MNLKAQITASYSSELKSVLEVDSSDHNDRCDRTIRKEGKSLVIDFNAKDSVALRAALNGITKLITTYEKTVDVVEQNQKQA